MRRTFIPILIFVVGQLASVTILVLWIVLAANWGPGVWWLIQGVLLMIPVIGGTSIIFVYWTKSRLLDAERINFISGVSHELLTPVASLRLYVETMLARDVDERTRRGFLQLMLMDTDRLADSISSILLASKIERGRALYHFKLVDIAQFIGGFLASNQPLLASAQLATDLDAKCLAMIDEASFATVLKNLIGNAVRYSPEPAAITISLRRRKKRLALSISDRGEGLDAGERKKIFRMFYRASKKHGGSGVGLFLVQKTVAAHGGKVWAESPGPGQGTTFHIVLRSARATEE